MHVTEMLLMYWGLALLTLSLALCLLSVFYAIVENDLDLHGLRKEGIIAVAVSFIEAVVVWLIVVFLPAGYRSVGLRAAIVAAIIAGLVYRIAHLETWSRYDVLFLLLFQAVIVCVVGFLILGSFGTALTILACFIALLAIVAAIVKGT